MPDNGKKVLLISPPSRVFNHYRPPLALMYLAGYLKKNNIAAKIIDVILHNQVRDKEFLRNKDQYRKHIEEETVARVVNECTDIVGITCYTPELGEVETLAKRIKSARPDITVIVGGVHATLYPEQFLRESSSFDYVVIGEGEVTLLELISTIRSNVGNSGIVQGIAYYDKNLRQIVKTGMRPLMENIDDIAFPDYEDLDMKYYTTASPYAIRGVFTRSFYISSSRGCPSSCTFCVSKKLREYHGIKHYARLRSPQSLFNEIRMLREKYSIDSFYFIDDLFTLRRDNVVKFCELLQNSGLSLIWGCSSKVNTVDYETLKVMRDSGCVQIDFGVEKGSDAMLAKVKKGITLAQIVQTFHNCHQLGIRTFANVLVNTPDEKEEDLNDIVSLLEKIRPTIVSANIFTPYPGCEIFDELCDSVSREDYALLMEDPAELVKQHPEKFRFSIHFIDIRRWTGEVMQRFNTFSANACFFVDRRYLRSIFHSRCKFDYIKQSGLLVREYINQKM